jgi:hypothetical protein
MALAAGGALADDDGVLLRDSARMPSRAYDWNLPEQPNRPSLPLPHFDQNTILPEQIEFNTIPKTNMMPENLRPWNIENQAFMLNSLVRDRDIIPQHLLDAPLEPPKPAPVGRVTIDKPYDGSMIFLPELPPPTTVHRVRPEFEDMLPVPDQRRLLGW